MKNRHDSATETPEQLIEHISRLMAEAEAMIAGPVAQQGSSTLADMKARLQEAKERVSEAYCSARKNVIRGAKYTDETIRQHPYQSIGIAVGVGALVGYLLGRRGNS